MTFRRSSSRWPIGPHVSLRSSDQAASARRVWRWKWLASLRAEDTYRVFFVPLAGLHSPAFVASAIAEALGLSDTTALDLPRRTGFACADQPTLLVIDNFEQVLDAAPLITDLLASVAPLRVLATSRAPLRVRGEREYVVDPLSLHVDDGAIAAADGTGASAAVQLFVERVRDAQPQFSLTPGKRCHGKRYLPAARRAAACARTRSPLDEAFERRRSARPPRR